MARTSRYARCESPKRSWTLSTTAANGHSQRNQETGEPDDATSILSGSAGGWEKRPKGPRSQPTQLQGSRSTRSCVGFPSVFAFQEGMWGTPISALWNSPTVSGGFVRLAWRAKNPLPKCLIIFVTGAPRAQPSLQWGVKPTVPTSRWERQSSCLFIG
jgi:hypothetical protein